MISLSNKTILITGASSGIGRATASLCNQLGAFTILSGRNESELNISAKDLKNPFKIIAADLTDPIQFSNLIQECNQLDGVVNGAGIVQPLPIKYIRQKNISEIFSINFNASVLLTSELSHQKKINAHCSVVFISSISAQHPYNGGALYSASKAAIEAYSRSFALEHASKKIRSNVISPALVTTRIFEETAMASTPEEMLAYEKQYPLGFGTPEDVAECIVFLLSDKSKWITGTTISMDGGLLLNSKK